MRTKEEFVQDFIRKSNSKLLRKAFDFAAHVHKDHKRQDGAPYIVHPNEVCYVSIINDVTGIHTLCMELLHDTVEEARDQSGIIIPKETIAQLLNLDIAEGVYTVTKFKKNMTSQELGEYFRKIEEDIRLIILKTIDRYVNIRRSMFGVYDRERITRYIHETVTYILPMSERVVDSGRYPEYENVLRRLRSSIKGILEGAKAHVALMKKNGI